MKHIFIAGLLFVFTLVMPSCKEEEPQPGSKFSGRLLESCDNPSALGSRTLEIWEDARPLSGNDSSAEKFIASAQTDDGGFFVFRYDFDTVPMSLRLKNANNETVILAKGVFGWHNYINTFNNIVADVLEKGNKARIVINLHMPGGWGNGDSVVYRIADPNKAGGYQHIFRYGAAINDTVSDVRAFTRMMDNQLRPTPLDRKFVFPVNADFYVSGSKVSKVFWVPTTTCAGDSLHVFRLQM